MKMNMRRQAASRLQSLPDELILEIFLRVPVRSVVSLKCVCKSWRILISGPQFAKDYFRISFSSMTPKRLASLAYYNRRKSITTCSVQSLLENPLAPRQTSSFNVENRLLHILGSCNGLLCLADGFCLFTLMNPLTRSASEKSPPLSLEVRLDAMEDEVARYGFGYDQLNDKYKVLITYGFPRVTKLYTFGTDSSWITIQNFPCDQVPPLWAKLGKFVSGTINWVVPERNCIISFDMEKETYGEVLLPLHMDGDHPSKHLLDVDVLSNCLSLCYFNDIHYVVWVMKKYGNQQSWAKLMLIPHSKLKMPRHMRMDASFRFAYLRPLWISENGIAFKRILDIQLVIYKNDKLEDDRKIMGRDTHNDIHIYHESLISPP